MSDRTGSDAPDRYAIYVVAVGANVRLRLAETSLDGIGVCLRTLRDEDQFNDHSRMGIFDRHTREWLVNPWAAGKDLP